MNSPFLLAAGLLFGATVCAQAVVVGQVDTFEDGTTQNWGINLLGMGAPPTEVLPTNISSGGPAGVDDNFLLLLLSLGVGALALLRRNRPQADCC